MPVQGLAGHSGIVIVVVVGIWLCGGKLLSSSLRTVSLPNIKLVVVLGDSISKQTSPTVVQVLALTKSPVKGAPVYKTFIPNELLPLVGLWEVP